ncbi:MAG: 3-isopropylmalate dehydratase small subunit [Chitinivibrionales bacterium]|nr:3-isopropylmalate dehydratase small subunit [Chitinivibrionales bacterium]
MTATPHIASVTGTAIPLPGDDIDTDRIIPARFMRCVSFDGLGQFAFYDERFDENGNEKDHPLNNPRYREASILVVGNNFGCGSSREHAPQALMRYGVKAIIGISFADIFRGNCTTMGIPTICVSREVNKRIMQSIIDEPQTEVGLHLDELRVTVGSNEFAATIPDDLRMALTQGMWDTTSVLLANVDKIEARAAAIPYMDGFA